MLKRLASICRQWYTGSATESHMSDMLFAFMVGWTIGTVSICIRYSFGGEQNTVERLVSEMLFMLFFMFPAIVAQDGIRGKRPLWLWPYIVSSLLLCVILIILGLLLIFRATFKFEGAERIGTVFYGLAFLIFWPFFLNNAKNVNNLRKQWTRGDFRNDYANTVYQKYKDLSKELSEIRNLVSKKMEEERKLTNDDNVSILANDNGKSSLIENSS